MRIAMILDGEFPPDPRVENEATTLVGAGHDVHLFCISYKPGLPEQERISGFSVHRSIVPAYIRSLSALAYSNPLYHLYYRTLIKSFIQSVKPEVLHVHDMAIARAVFWANSSSALPVVLDLHENRPEIMKYYAHVNTFLGKLLINPASWKKFEFRYIKQADHLVVVTPAAKEYYKREVPGNETSCTVLPNTVRRSFFENYEVDQSIIKRYADDFVILYLGDTGIRRGLLTAIRAMPIILQNAPSARLVIVGKSMEDDLLKKAIDDAGVADHVDQLGWQPFKSFQSFILASKVGICPLHRNLHHDTTYANKVIQTMAMGRPVVVSDCTAQRELVEKFDAGLVFPAESVAAYAKAVVRLYEDKETYDRLAENARQAVSNSLNWEELSQDLIRYYSSF